MRKDAIRPDHKVILEFIRPQASVLDLGCGNGDLLSLLTEKKGIRGQGIDIDDEAIYQCVAKGLNVFHGDIDSGLSEYADKSFDCVILNQSLQQVKHLKSVLDDALRVGEKVIVGFPNFAYYKARLQLFFNGRAPVTPYLPYAWYESPNIHFLSMYDFLDFCRDNKVTVEHAVYLGLTRRVRFFPNLFAATGIFVISK